MNTKKIKTLALLFIFLWLGRICPDYRRFRVVEEESYHVRIVGEKK
jgi:hypothetical protein